MRSNSETSDRSRKIAIVSVSRSIEGGAEVVLGNLLQAFGQCGRLTLVSPAGCGLEASAQSQGIHWVELPSMRDSFLSNLAGFWRIRKQLSQAAVLHAWTRRSFEIVALASSILRIPCSATLHDQLYAPYISRARRTLMTLAGRKIDPLVCVSHHLRAALGHSFLSSHATVIPNGVPDFRSTMRRTDNGSLVKIGFAGMHHLHKGFPVVAAWIRQLLGSGVSVQFELFGDIHPEWKAPADELESAFPGRVQLRGRVSVEEIFDDIDVLVQVSYPVVETFGMVLAEAACAGIPVVTSAHGAEAEVVQDGKTGFLFQPDQPEVGLSRLIELIQDAQLRRRMGLHARHLYEESFRIEIMKERYLMLWSVMQSQNGLRKLKRFDL